ncbi:hypothetical protein FXO38_19434 [Capsicum annuum]|nr:hypothetical protein FXO38_19434 [Capsicum annuum]KAF3654222.1 hypothetical protein FXO37_16595 [Capsicum annuum]
MGKRALIPSAKAQMAKEAAMKSRKVEKAQKAQTKEKKLEVQVLVQKQWSTTVAPVQSTLGKGTKSCANEVEEKTMQSETAHSIWDRFEISKVWNAGFKLDYVSPMKQGEKTIIDIDFEDIESEFNTGKVLLFVMYWELIPNLR